MNREINIIGYILLVFIATILSSCKEKNQTKEIVKIITEWQNKKIIFPDNMIFSNNGQDSLDYIIPQSDYKILLYVDSIGCVSCNLNLNQWSKFISEIDSLTSNQVPVLMFFHPKDKREILYLLKRDAITTPVCLDMDDKLNSINNFPSRNDFQCFLLDKNDKVVGVGNPISNPKVKEMYLEQITSINYVDLEHLPNTTVKVEKVLFDLGTIKHGKSITITATITNTGDSPLIIHDIETSCECTTVDYKKGAVSPSSTFEVDITYNADDLGFFDRVVYIYGNFEKSPLMIELEGDVK